MLHSGMIVDHRKNHLCSHPLRCSQPRRKEFSLVSKEKTLCDFVGNQVIARRLSFTPKIVFNTTTFDGQNKIGGTFHDVLRLVKVSGRRKMKVISMRQRNATICTHLSKLSITIADFTLRFHSLVQQCFENIGKQRHRIESNSPVQRHYKDTGANRKWKAHTVLVRIHIPAFLAQVNLIPLLSPLRKSKVPFN